MDPTIDADTLAAAVADGTPIDWDSLAARAATPDERTRLARFALIARVCGVHADASSIAPVISRADAPPDYHAGDHWGSLRIVERLAAGTFGTVYRAHDPALARDVALKILCLARLTTLPSRPCVKAVCWHACGTPMWSRCTAPINATGASVCGWSWSRAPRSRTNLPPVGH